MCDGSAQFRDRREQQVRADRDLGGQPEDEGEQRGHQRTATDPGCTDHGAHQRTAYDVFEQHGRSDLRWIVHEAYWLAPAL